MFSTNKARTKDFVKPGGLERLLLINVSVAIELHHDCFLPSFRLLYGNPENKDELTTDATRADTFQVLASFTPRERNHSAACQHQMK